MFVILAYHVSLAIVMVWSFTLPSSPIALRFLFSFHSTVMNTHLIHEQRDGLVESQSAQIVLLLFVWECWFVWRQSRRFPVVKGRKIEASRQTRGQLMNRKDMISLSFRTDGVPWMEGGCSQIKDKHTSSVRTTPRRTRFRDEQYARIMATVWVDDDKTKLDFTMKKNNLELRMRDETER